MLFVKETYLPVAQVQFMVQLIVQFIVQFIAYIIYIYIYMIPARGPQTEFYLHLRMAYLMAWLPEAIRNR